MDAIGLELDVSCIIGILPREREEPQRMNVALRLEMPLGTVGETGDLALGVDYAVVDGIVRFLAVEGQFRLLESLGLAVLRAVLAPPAPGERRGPVERAWIRLTKPTVLRAASPAVELTRDAAWARVPSEPHAGGGTTELLLAVPEVSVRRVVLPTGGTVSVGAAFGLTTGGALPVPLRVQAPTPILSVRRPAPHG